MINTSTVVFLSVFLLCATIGVDSADCRQLRCVNGDDCSSERGQCVCHPGWAGPICTVAIATTACSSDPCVHGKCSLNANTRNGYICKCDDRFQGENCDIDKNECEFTVCESGGKCVNRTPNGSLSSTSDPGFVCICPEYRTGRKCEIEIDLCTSSSAMEAEPYCKNGGTCSASTCACQDGWSGRTCDRAIPLKQELFNSGCTTSDSVATYCLSRFADGKCDVECASEACFFDGFDCLRKDSKQGDLRLRGCREYNLCSRVYSDGVCNKECNVAECGFDGGDCELPDALARLGEDSQLIGVSVLAPPSVVLNNLRWLQSDLGQRLFNGHVKVASDHWGRLVFEWDPEWKYVGIEGLGRRVPTMDEQLVARNYSTAQGTIVFFDIDTTGCRKMKNPKVVNCFESVTLAVQFLSIEMARNRIKIGTMAISTISAVNKEAPSWQHALPLLLVLAFALVVLLIIVVLLVIVHVRNSRRKVVSAPIWTIPNEFAYQPPTPPYNPDSPPHEIKNNRSADVVYPPLMQEDPALLLAIRRGDLHTVSEMITSIDEVVDAVDGQGLGPLHHAVANNDFEMLNLLVASDQFDIFDRNLLGQSALVYAARVGHPHLDCYTLLVQAIGKKRRDCHRADNSTSDIYVEGSRVPCSSIFSLALQGEHQRTWALIDDLGRSAVHYAAINNIPHLIHYLSAYGADVSLTDEMGATPLHLACKDGHLEAVSALLECNAHTATVDIYDRTPYRLAEERAQWAVLELLRNNHPKKSSKTVSTPRSLNRIKRPRVVSSADRTSGQQRRESSDGYHSLESTLDRADSFTRSNNALTVPLMNGPPSVIEQIRLDGEKQQVGAGDWKRLSGSQISQEQDFTVGAGYVSVHSSRPSLDGRRKLPILTPPAQVLGLGGYAVRANTLPAVSTSPIYSSIYDVLSPPPSCARVPPNNARQSTGSPCNTISETGSLPSPYSMPPLMQTFK